MDIDGAKLLSDLLLALDHDPNLISVAELQRVADRLAALVRHEPGWGWRYLRNVLNHKMEPSKKLMDALADSKLCENPACYIEFVPRHPWQRFHSARCRELNRRGGKG